jgi:hypothetical protein
LPFSANLFHACEATSWHVQYRKAAANHVEWYPDSAQAVEAACRLLDEGCDVYAMGMELTDATIGRDEIARIHAFWARPKHPFGIRPGQAENRPEGD